MKKFENHAIKYGITFAFIEVAVHQKLILWLQKMK